MFTGIVQGKGIVHSISPQDQSLSFSLRLPPSLAIDLVIGASVAVDGVCLTAVRIEENRVWFDAIAETLKKTTLADLKVGQEVNIERAAKIGSEIGGHLLSGHIIGKALIQAVHFQGNSRILTLQGPAEWMRFLFAKGYIALDGASLTLVDVYPEGRFTVHLIPETQRLTTLGSKEVGASINVEIDAQTQAIVETVERYLKRSQVG